MYIQIYHKNLVNKYTTICRINSGCENMEKFYCEYCRILYNEETICLNCGKKVEKKLKIEVHYQKTKKDKIE